MSKKPKTYASRQFKRNFRMSGSFWPNSDQERAQLAASLFAKSPSVNGLIMLSKSTLTC